MLNRQTAMCRGTMIAWRLRDGIVRHKWISLVVSLSLVFSTLWMTDKISHKHLYKSWRPEKEIEYQYYHVLLNSYMCGGSTLTGAVLGWRADAFYIYEPLWKMSRWAYWKGNSAVCSTRQMLCKDIAQDGVVEAKFVNNLNGSPAGTLLQALNAINKVYDCQMTGFERMIVGNSRSVTVNIGGPGWADVRECIKDSGDVKSCINKLIPGKCKQARHIVTKILRLTVDNLEVFLTRKADLKIIHLFRDPRAIINSRIATRWYPTKNRFNILDNACALCDKMLVDFKHGERLMALYPNRFRFLYYEDMNEDPLRKVKLIYKYLKMDMNETKYLKIRNMYVFRSDRAKTERQRNTAFWWRHELDWNLVKEIDVICKDVLNALGYKTFSSEDEMKNLSIPSVGIPTEYLLHDTV